MLAVTTEPEPQWVEGGMRLDYLEFNAIEKVGRREKKPVNGLDFPKGSDKQGMSADCSL